MRIDLVLASLGVASLVACGDASEPPRDADRSPCVVVSFEGEAVAGRFVPTVARYGCGGCIGKQPESSETERQLGFCPSW
jgi:hypothetical protein